MLTILIISFVLLALLRVPIALGLGIATLAALVFGSHIPLEAIPHRMVNGIDSYVFIAIPLFLFAGRLMNAGGITDRLFRFARALVGHVSGGLAHANVLAGMFFSAISGSAVAAVGGLGEIEMKAMRENGYDDEFSASVAVAASVLGPVIPPSIPLIIYASMTENSVGKLFLGGVIPGIMLAVSLMFLIYILSKIRKYPRDVLPKLSELARAGKEAVLPLLMPVIMLGGIYSGIFTPTEAAAAAGLYALIISLFVYKTIRIKDLPKILVETMITTSVVTFVISMTSSFSFVLSIENTGRIVTGFIEGLAVNKFIILLVINLILLIFGAIMEAGVVLILFIPILYPIAVNLGVDPVHFGVIMAVNLMIGVATPPMGMCLFVMSQISGIRLETLMRKILIFLVPLITVLLLITYIPKLVTWLPDHFDKQTTATKNATAPLPSMEFPAGNENIKPAMPGFTGQKKIIRIGLTHSKNHSFTRALEMFAMDFEAATSGKYEIRIFHSAQLGGEKEMQEMLTLGTLDMSVTGILNTYEPMFSVFELPYLFTNRAEVINVNNSPLMDSVAASLETRGLKLTGFLENGFRNVTNSVRPVNTPSDMEGLLIRTPENPAEIETIRALGAIPSPMAFNELYTALVQGVVDGQENPLQNIWFGRLYEAQKYLALTHHIYNSAYVVSSLKFWNTLTPNEKDLLKKAMQEASAWQMKYMEALDTVLEKRMEEYGVAITKPDLRLFAEASRPAYQALYKQLGPEAERIVKRIRELNDSVSKRNP